LDEVAFAQFRVAPDNLLGKDLQDFVNRKRRRQPELTKACRTVLMETDHPVGAREVCELIEQLIVPVLLHHKDPLASVATALNQLVEYGEARAVRDEHGLERRCLPAPDSAEAASELLARILRQVASAARRVLEQRDLLLAEEGTDSDGGACNTTRCGRTRRRATGHRPQAILPKQEGHGDTENAQRFLFAQNNLFR